MEGIRQIHGCNILKDALHQRHPTSGGDSHGYLGGMLGSYQDQREIELDTRNLVVREQT